MGGKSKSYFSVAKTPDGSKTMNFTGSCEVVPFLHAPGFCKLFTRGAKKFPDVSEFSAGALHLRVRSSTPQYTGFKVAFSAVPMASLCHSCPPDLCRRH